MFDRNVEKERRNKKAYYEAHREEKIAYQRAYHAKRRLEKLNAPIAAAQEQAPLRRSSRLDPKKRESEVALVDDRQDKQLKTHEADEHACANPASSDEWTEFLQQIDQDNLPFEYELPLTFPTTMDVSDHAADAEVPFYDSGAAFALLFSNNSRNESDIFDLPDEKLFNFK